MQLLCKYFTQFFGLPLCKSEEKLWLMYWYADVSMSIAKKIAGRHGVYEKALTDKQPAGLFRRF